MDTKYLVIVSQLLFKIKKGFQETAQQPIDRIRCVIENI